MTIAARLAELPPMPKREDTDKWIALFPANDVIKAAAIAGFYEAEASSLRARLSLALGVLAAITNCAIRDALDRETTYVNTADIQDARLVLEAMKELRGHE